MAVNALLLSLAALSQYGLAAPIEDNAILDSLAARATDGHLLEARDRPYLALRPVQAPADRETSIDQQVVPQSSVSLHYAGVAAGNSTQQSSALVDIPKVKYPIVNAVGASAISSVTCSGGQARVSFADQAAFDQAASSWTSADPFTLITFSDSCGTGLDDAQHDFVLVNRIVSHATDSLSILVDYTDIQLEDAVAPDALISVKLGTVPRLGEHFADGYIPTYSQSISKQLKWSSYKTNAASPFGPAYQLYKGDKLQAYCVGCGTDGAFVLTAAAKFTLLGKVEAASISINGALNGGLVFGLAGTAGVTVPLPEITLAQFALEGLYVPGILTLGPSATIAAGGSISVKAAGRLSAGARLHWPNAKASIDFVSSARTSSGWTPTVEPVLNADGAISSTLDLHLTNTLAFGLSIPRIKFVKQVALIDQPGVQVDAAVEGSVSLKDGKIIGGFTGACKGVTISASFYNNLKANLFNIKTYNLFDWTSPQIRKCVVLSGIAANEYVSIAKPATLTTKTSTTVKTTLPTTKATTTTLKATSTIVKSTRTTTTPVSTAVKTTISSKTTSTLATAAGKIISLPILGLGAKATTSTTLKPVSTTRFPVSSTSSSSRR